MTVETGSSGSRRQRYRRLSIKSLDRQRGALGILGALTLLLSVLFTALAVVSSDLFCSREYQELKASNSSGVIAGTWIISPVRVSRVGLS